MLNNYNAIRIDKVSTHCDSLSLLFVVFICLNFVNPVITNESPLISVN